MGNPIKNLSQSIPSPDLTLTRCDWVNNTDALYITYHDQEWGKPCLDRNTLFAMLCLEGQQAGLSWYTVLKKRAHYYTSFHHFVPEKVSGIDDEMMNELKNDPGLIRHLGKLSSIVSNAQALLKMEAEGENFVEFIWSFVNGKSKINHFNSIEEIPASTEESIQLSKALKKRGFRFVGPTICYAFMQATGLVNDHLLSCHFRE
ncbi:DNA-3-methyladenine glycosylase I [Thorsellia kenyensis]|uniref:DNA-3-methyladenine glycosylase I n=1 Tax=Thorsellia kenyensis TaxID=1549888 RepID=A0ABV6CCL4_9GAMM